MSALDRARAAAEAVPDPELVDVSVGDLGIVRDVRLDAATVVVTVTPTYTACPAWETICADIEAAVLAAGFGAVEVVRRTAPPWTTDWITDRGRRLLAEHGIAPPVPTPEPACVRCGAASVQTVSRFGPSACTSLNRCTACGETFTALKAVPAAKEPA